MFDRCERGGLHSGLRCSMGGHHHYYAQPRPSWPLKADGSHADDCGCWTCATERRRKAEATP